LFTGSPAFAGDDEEKRARAMTRKGHGRRRGEKGTGDDEEGIVIIPLSCHHPRKRMIQ
jgi:hypothetical protein